jgi:hypothetical protein
MMNQKHVPIRKQSKQKQREYYAARRGDWGGLNPVTRKPPNPKAYNRRKSGPSSMHEPRPGFFIFRLFLSQRFFQRFQRV